MAGKLILASASPRRHELLTLGGYEFKVVPSNADELKESESPARLVEENSFRKAYDIYKNSAPCSVVLGSDTVVVMNGNILGKPKDIVDAKRMLSMLSGSTHEVITGYAVIADGFEKIGHCVTEVKFKKLTEAEIDSYIATKEPMDKAGAYAIQEKGSLFVESVKGDLFNVIGLPIGSVYPILAECGIKPRWVTK